MTVFALLAGIAIGAGVVYLLMRGRVATAQERARAAVEKYALLERTRSPRQSSWKDTSASGWT